MSKSESDPIKLVVTPGEPAGIGPELVLAIPGEVLDAQILIAADPELLAERARGLSLRVEINDWAASREFRKDCLNVLPVRLGRSSLAGKLDPQNSAYVLETLEQAVRLCESGQVSGMVTGPVNKAIINDAGIPFSGHTEWLADRTGTHRVVMMLATEGLRVALATTHLPLRAVADAIDETLLIDTVSILHRDLERKLGILQPRIAVCGLNPHAGEGGHLGREEIDIIMPALRHLLEEGLNVIGPIPADTAFTPQMLKSTDAIVAMYHDQGLPVLKHKGFGAAVNVTLGLPFVRTSVDHGTALDLAGRGTADPQSLFAAIEYARNMASQLKS